MNTIPIDDAAIVFHGAVPTADAGWRWSCIFHHEGAVFGIPLADA